MNSAVIRRRLVGPPVGTPVHQSETKGKEILGPNELTEPHASLNIGEPDVSRRKTHLGFSSRGSEPRRGTCRGAERKEHSVRAKKERPGRGSLANRGTRGRLDRTEASGRTSAETVEGSDEEAAGRTIRRRDRKKEGKKDYLDLDRAAVRRMPRRSVNGAGVGGNTMPPPGPRWGDQKVEGAWIRLYTIRPFLLALLLLTEYFSRVGSRDSVDLVVGQRKAQPPNYLSLSPVLHLQ
jgi:hypothetical protein